MQAPIQLEQVDVSEVDTLPAGTTGLVAGNDGKLYVRDGANSPVLIGDLSNPPTIRVAASNAAPAAKEQSNFICDGVADEVQIQAAVNLLAGTGGTVLLTGGQFNIAQKITISASNVRIVGESGNSTIIATSWNSGTPITQFIEILGTNDSNRIFGNEIANVAFASDAPYATTPTGFIGHPPGVLRGVYAQFVADIKLQNIHGNRVSFVVDVRNANDVVTSQITGREIFGAVSLIRTRRATVSDIIVDKAESAVDLGACQFAAITNVTGLASTVRNTDELLDIGGSQDVTISNCVADGFFCGINIKYEIGDVPEPARITIANCTIKNNLSNGIRINNVGQTGTRMGPISVSNCIVGSESANSVGINVLGNYREVVLSNNTIRSNLNCIIVDGCIDSSIVNNICRSEAGPGIRIHKNAVPVAERILVKGNQITKGTYGVWISSGVLDCVVDSNVIENCSLHGIWSFANKRPRITNNCIRAIQQTGIYLQWNNDTQFDTTPRQMNWVCDGNYVQDCSLAALGHRLIWVHITEITGSAYRVASLSNNQLIVTPAGQSTIGGIRIESSVNWNELKIVGNLFSNNISNPLHIQGVGVLESNCRVRANVGVADV